MAQPRVVIPLLLATALALRLPGLGESLWFDEVIYATRWQIHDWQAAIHFALYGPFAPLYPVLSYCWSAVAGDREVLVRLPSLVCALMSIAEVYLLAGRYCSGWMPLLSGLILCVAPAHVWYSREAAPYMFTAACALTAVLAQTRVAAAPGRWDAVYAAALIGAVFAHFYAAALLLPLTIASLRAPAAARRRLLSVTAAVAVLLAVLLVFKFAHGALATDRGFLRPFTAFEWWMLFFNWYLLGNSLWPVSPYRTDLSQLLQLTPLVAVQLLAAVVVVRGLLPDRRDATPRAWDGELALYLLSAPAAAWLLTEIGHGRIYVERYLLFPLPFFAIALARGATRSLPRVAAFGLGASMLMLTAASFVGYLARPTTWTVYKHNPDWQATVRYVASQQVTADPPVIFAVVPIDDLAFYVRRDLRGRHAQVRMYSDAALEEVLAGRGSDPFYLVNNDYWPGEFNRTFARLQRDPRLRQGSVQTFRGVTLYSFRRAP